MQNINPPVTITTGISAQDSSKESIAHRIMLLLKSNMNVMWDIGAHFFQFGVAKESASGQEMVYVSFKASDKNYKKGLYIRVYYNPVTEDYIVQGIVHYNMKTKDVGTFGGVQASDIHRAIKTITAGDKIASVAFTEKNDKESPIKKVLSVIEKFAGTSIADQVADLQGNAITGWMRAVNTDDRDNVAVLDLVKPALDSGEITKAIIEGRIMPNDTIIIIQAAGLDAPPQISSIAEIENSFIAKHVVKMKEYLDAFHDEKMEKGGSLSLPKELSGKRKFSHLGFGGIDGIAEHTSGHVNLEDLKVLDNGIATAKNKIANDKSFKPSKEPITVGVDIVTGEQQLLDGYHRYVLRGGVGESKANFLPMKDGDIIRFETMYGDGGEVMTYYNSHGHKALWSEIRETEIERGNYTDADFDGWEKKYDIKPTDKAIWVTPSKRSAYSYMAEAEMHDKIMDMSEEKLEKYAKRKLGDPYEYSSESGIAIPESDDGDNGFLFVVKPVEQFADGGELSGMKQIDEVLGRALRGERPLAHKYRAFIKESKLGLFHYHHLLLVYDLKEKKADYTWHETRTDKRGLDAALKYLDAAEIKLEAGGHIYHSVGIEGNLVGKSRNPYIGKEHEVECSDKDIRCFASEFSYRFVYVWHGKKVSVLQFDKEKDYWILRNAYTGEKYRKQGLATKLYEEAKRHLNKIVFSQNLSPDGKAYKASIEKRFYAGGVIDLLHTGSDTTAFESASPDIVVEGNVVINHDPQVDSFDSWEKGGVINSLIERIKNKLVEDNGNDSWQEFVDGQSLGECQSIAFAIKYDFPKVENVFGEIEVDEEYTDEDGETQTIMTHHWIEVDGEIFDFSKGTTQNYIDWDDIYNPSVNGDEWRYRAIRKYDDGGLVDDIYTHEKIKKGFVSFRIKYESGRSLKEEKSSVKSIDEAPFKELANLKMVGIDGISSSNYNISEWLVHRECMIVMPFKKLRELNELEQVKYFDVDYLMSNGMEAMFRLYDRKERTDRDYYSVLQTVFPKIAREFVLEADVKVSPSVSGKFYSLNDIYDVYQSGRFIDYMSKRKRVNSAEEMAAITVDYILSGQMKADNYYIQIPESITVEEIIEPIKRGIIYSGSVYREESEWRVKNKALNIPDGSQLFFVLGGYENMQEEYEKLIAKYDLRKHYTVNYIPYKRLNEFQMQRFNMQRERGEKEFEESKLEVDKKIRVALEHTKLEILEDVEPQIKAEINESIGSESFSNEDGERYGDVFSVPVFKNMFEQIFSKFSELFDAEASNVVKNKNKYYVESAIRAFNVYLEELESKLGGTDSGIMGNWGKKIYFYDFIHPVTRIFRNLNYMPYLDKIKEKVGADLFKYYDKKTTMMARGGVIQKGSSKKSIEQNKRVGQKMLSDEALKHETSESLLRSGGFSNDALDLAAFGFTEETVKTIMPDELTVKWKDDFDNVTYQQEKSGLSKEAWAKKIDLSEPIDVSFDGQKFNIEDGHHRYYAAKILNKPLKVNLEIKANPIVALTELEYDEFHRNYFDKVKTTTMEKGGTVYEGETEPGKKRNDTWYKQKEWKGNPELGYESYMKHFPFINRSIPVFIWGKAGLGKNTPILSAENNPDGSRKLSGETFDSPDWHYTVSAGANSDYSYTGGFYPETPTLEEAMKIVDEKFKQGKLIYADGGEIFAKGGLVMTENIFDDIVKNQTRIPDKDGEKYIERIVKLVASNPSMFGFRVDNFIVNKVEPQKGRRRFYLYNKAKDYGIDISNLKYKSELRHVRGLEDCYYGIYDNYLIYNYGGGVAFVYELNKKMATGGTIKAGDLFGSYDKDKDYKGGYPTWNDVIKKYPHAVSAVVAAWGISHSIYEDNTYEKEVAREMYREPERGAFHGTYYVWVDEKNEPAKMATGGDVKEKLLYGYPIFDTLKPTDEDYPDSQLGETVIGEFIVTSPTFFFYGSNEPVGTKLKLTLARVQRYSTIKNLRKGLGWMWVHDNNDSTWQIIYEISELKKFGVVKLFSDDVIFNKKMATGGEVKKKEEKLGTALYFLEREKMFSIRSASKEMKRAGKNWRVTKINFTTDDEDLGLFSDAEIMKLARDNGFEKLQTSDLENLIYSEAEKCKHLECDGAVRVLDFALNKNNVEHYVFEGIVRLGEKIIPLHFWIGLPDGRIVDFKAQMWLGNDAPNGIFFPADTKAIYEGKVVELNTTEIVYNILTHEI